MAVWRLCPREAVTSTLEFALHNEIPDAEAFAVDKACE
jgi:hypothetical protein